MSAAVLRAAAKLMREQQSVEENLGHIDAREYATWLAVADWLDAAAEHDETACPAVDSALAVARAYLGTDAPP